MSACEKCWRDASARVLYLGGSVADHYADLLRERANTPCSPQEQSVDAVATPMDEGKAVPSRMENKE
jgi:hypothetical protein